MLPIELRIEQHQIPETLRAAATLLGAMIQADRANDFGPDSSVYGWATTQAVRLLRKVEECAHSTLSEEADDQVGDSLGDYIESIGAYLIAEGMRHDDAEHGEVVTYTRFAHDTILDMLSKATTYARVGVVFASINQDADEELRAAATEALGILNARSPGSGPIQQTAYRLWRALGLDVKGDPDPDDDRGPVVDVVTDAEDVAGQHFDAELKHDVDFAAQRKALDDLANELRAKLEKSRMIDYLSAEEYARMIAEIEDVRSATSQPTRTAADALADTVKRFAAPTPVESLLPPGPLLPWYSFQHVEHLLKTYAGKAHTRVFRLRAPYYWLAAGTLLLRNCVGEYFVTMPDGAWITSEIKCDTPKLTAETVLSHPDIFEEILPAYTIEAEYVPFDLKKSLDRYDGATAGGDRIHCGPKSYTVPVGCAREINAAAIELYGRAGDAAAIIDEEGSNGADSAAAGLRASVKRMRIALRGLEVQL